MTITTAAEWADALDEEIGGDWNAYSLAFAAGVAAGVGLDAEADGYDDEARVLISTSGWRVRWHETAGWIPA